MFELIEHCRELTKHAHKRPEDILKLVATVQCIGIRSTIPNKPTHPYTKSDNDRVNSHTGINKLFSRTHHMRQTNIVMAPMVTNGRIISEYSVEPRKLVSIIANTSHRNLVRQLKDDKLCSSFR